MSERGLDTEHVEELRRDRILHGELNPIVKDKRTGKILDGRHRERAGWKSITWVTTKDDLDVATRRLSFLDQRKAAYDEVAEVLTGIAKELEKGGMDPTKIAAHIVGKISPFSKTLTYELLPNRYKSGEGRPRGSLSFRGSETNGGSPTDLEIEVRHRSEGDTNEATKLGKCFNCGVQGRITPLGLERPA